jgi:hypothetical protein
MDSRRSIAWRRLFFVVFVTLAWISIPGTTTVAASPYVYDAPAVARVAVHEIGAADVRSVQLSGAREWCASPPDPGRGTLTTRFAPCVATNTETALYRAVSEAERADLVAGNGFRAGPNSYEGKLFATTPEDAASFGRINDSLTPGGEPFHIVETRVPGSAMNGFERMPMDGMPAVHVPEGQLGVLGPPNIWDSVPWFLKGAR